MLSCFSCVRLFATPWTVVLCPWNFPGKNTGMGCHALLHEIFLTQGSNPCHLHLLHCSQILYYWATMEAQIYSIVFHFKKGKQSLTSGHLYSLSPSGKLLEEVVYTSCFHCLASCLLLNTINLALFFSWSLTMETLIVKSIWHFSVILTVHMMLISVPFFLNLTFYCISTLSKIILSALLSFYNKSYTYF